MATQTFAKEYDTSKKLTQELLLWLHKIIWMMLFYPKAIDLTLLVVLVAIAASQTSVTIKTDKSVYKLLDYCSTYTDATIRYKASGMIIKAHSDVSYLS